MTTTETQTQLGTFQIHRDFFLFDALLEEKVPCPFCETRLQALDVEYVHCPNPECPYLDATVREVVAALQSQGHDPLRAAQIAALYSVNEDEDAQPVTAERFTVTDYSSADWVLKKLAEYQRRAGRILDMAGAEIAAIEARRDQILRPVKRQIEFFETAFRDALAEWTRKEIAGQKTRTVNLLHGRLWYKRNPDSVDVEDEAAAITMAEDLEIPDVVCKALSRTAARKALDTLPKDSPWRSLVSIKPGNDVFHIKAESLEA